jgi:PIN domain nuclease of toxin-antitoxin system
VNILLDTHVALWAITDDPKLGREAREHILNPSNIIYTSAATIWEIAIKHALGKKHMPISGNQAISYFSAAGYETIAITSIHAAAVEDLPDYHRDPFDRILVAQAISEPLHLLTHDSKLKAYSELVIPV